MGAWILCYFMLQLKFYAISGSFMLYLEFYAKNKILCQVRGMYIPKLNYVFNVFLLWIYTTIQKIIKIGQVVLEIWDFQKSSNLIGRELGPRLTSSRYQSKIMYSMYSCYEFITPYKKSSKSVKWFLRYRIFKIEQSDWLIAFRPYL